MLQKIKMCGTWRKRKIKKVEDFSQNQHNTLEWITDSAKGSVILLHLIHLTCFSLKAKIWWLVSIGDVIMEERE